MNSTTNHSIKILVACHKADPNIRQDDIYMPIQVGKALHPELDLGFQCDNTGDNISDKNESYCELTALYWAWKNLKNVAYIGLCHYRRYFDMSREDVINAAKCKKIILASPLHFSIPLWIDYSIHHNSEDLKTVGSIVTCTTEMEQQWIKTMYYNNRLSPFNMFLMPFSEFEKYCTWLFDVLSKTEKEIDISSNKYQARVFGFLSERLLNVYLQNQDITYIPVINTEQPNKKPNKIRAELSILKNNFIASFFYGKKL